MIRPRPYDYKVTCFWVIDADNRASEACLRPCHTAITPDGYFGGDFVPGGRNPLIYIAHGRYDTSIVPVYAARFRYSLFSELFLWRRCLCSAKGCAVVSPSWKVQWLRG